MVLAGAVCGVQDTSTREALKEARFFSVGRKVQRKTHLRPWQFTAEELPPLLLILCLRRLKVRLLGLLGHLGKQLLKKYSYANG